MTESQALEEISSALASFGADKSIIPEMRDDAVYDELFRQWTELKGPPVLLDVAEAVGIDSTGTLNRSLKRLASAGRVRRIAKGVWLPL